MRLDGCTWKRIWDTYAIVWTIGMLGDDCDVATARCEVGFRVVVILVGRFPK
jgi:hypothetical protein